MNNLDSYGAPSREVTTAAGIAGITDLFDAAPVAPALPATPVEYSTDELQIAVGLICNSYGEPDLKVVGETKSGAPKVEFVFTLPLGETKRTVEDKFWKRQMTGEITQIFNITRSLKKRISRLKVN